MLTELNSRGQQDILIACVDGLKVFPESIQAEYPQATERGKLFPNDEAAIKLVYLAVQDAAKKWTIPIRNWKVAMNRFMIEFGDRIGDHL